MAPDTTSIEGILFDLDGTIIDTYDAILHSMRYAMQTILGEDIPADRLMKKVGQPLKTQLEEFSSSEEQRDELLQVYRAYNAEHHDRLAKYFDGTREVLEKLKWDGYELGIVTSKMHGPAQHGLQLFQLEHYFSCLVGADDCTLHKPDPAPVIYGADLLGIPPQKCLYVGDSPYDIEAGNAANTITVAALWGMFTVSELKLQKPDFMCEHICDLEKILIPSSDR